MLQHCVELTDPAFQFFLRSGRVQVDGWRAFERGALGPFIADEDLSLGEV